jgi:outer membrane protein assembly factor BamD
VWLAGFLLVIVFFVMSCASTKHKVLMTPEARLKHAIELFNKGHYLDAKTELTIIVLNYPGSSVVDEAQYYLAESHFKLKEYILAAAEYEKLIRNYPDSKYADKARYKIGLCYYELSPNYGLDQKYTLKAIDEFQRFLEDYPNSPLRKDVEAKLKKSREKLAKKDYKAAELYRKMGEWRAAQIYYQSVEEKYYDTSFGPKALFWIGVAQMHQDKLDEAEVTLQSYLNKFPKGDYAARAKRYLKQIAKRKKTQAKKTARSAKK